MKTDKYGCVFSFRHVASDALVAYATRKRLSRTPPGDALRRPCHVGWNHSPFHSGETSLAVLGGAESGMEGYRRKGVREGGVDTGAGMQPRERRGAREREGRSSEPWRPRAFICIPFSSVTAWERRRDAAATHSREPRRAPRRQRFRD